MVFLKVSYRSPETWGGRISERPPGEQMTLRNQAYKGDPLRGGGEAHTGGEARSLTYFHESRAHSPSAQGGLGAVACVHPAKQTHQFPEPWGNSSVLQPCCQDVFMEESGSGPLRWDAGLGWWETGLCPASH